VDVNGGTLATAVPSLQEDPVPAAGAVYVGYQGRGTMSITNGGTVDSWNGYIGAFSGPFVNSNGTVTVSGSDSNWTISASSGAARLFISGSDGGVGLLTVKDGGQVQINNNSNQIPVQVGPSGTLTGNGTVKISNFPNERRVLVSGTLAPSGGTLTIDGILYLTSSASTVCNVTSTGVDKVEVTGSATLDGRLMVTVAPGTPPGEYILLHASQNIIGIFATYSINVPGCLGWSIRYDTDNGYVILDLEYTCN